MRYLLLPIVALMPLATMPAFAQPVSQHASNIAGMPIHSKIAPALPTVDLGPNATAGDYLHAAAKALTNHQTGLAQHALENAETLLLTRSVAHGAANTPDESQAVQNISAARRALGANDLTQSLDLVQKTIPMTEQASAGATMATPAAPGTMPATPPGVRAPAMPPATTAKPMPGAMPATPPAPASKY